MKTNIKYAAKRCLDERQTELVKAFVDEEFKKRKAIYTRRILLAVCIACNDLFKFGDKRLLWVLKAIEDILTDYTGRVPKDYRADDEYTDEVAKLMQDELLSRSKVHVCIK